MSDAASAPNIPGDWPYLWRQLRERTRDPAKNVPFVFYVFLGPFLFGGLGVWVEIVKLTISTTPAEYSSLITAISTFYPALGCSTALQLVLASASKNDRVLISFALMMLFAVLAPAILLQFFSTLHPKIVLELSLLCSICAVWLWWMTNGGDPTYMMPAPDAATGGQVDRKLPGDLSEYQA